MALQKNEGYWWFTLEANESIGAEFIFLMHFLGQGSPTQVDKDIERGITSRIMDVCRPDGTWAIYKDGPKDLSTTVECYFALKLAGADINAPQMVKAKNFILEHGGINASRVFTKIHLAMFGILPWSDCPAMPAELIFLPKWFPVNIYEFSSWARASIVPLLIVMSVKPVRRLPSGFLDELVSDVQPKNQKTYGLWGHSFIYLDKILKVYERHPLKWPRKLALKRCSDWVWRHVQRTEDIYPALAYAAVAFRTLGYPNNSPQIQRPLDALKSFQQHYEGRIISMPDTKTPFGVGHSSAQRVHQQCCISPVWDTPWALMALLEAGVSPDSPPLLKAARWLISKQITDFKGDWAVKNPNAEPGGWAFEFLNDYFPDIDDTIEVLFALKRIALPEAEKEKPIRKGLAWLLSMQNKDGGWGAFDKNQTLTLVNNIPFSDHGACLDPSSPDITGRMVELLAACDMTLNDPPLARAVNYIVKTQETFGGWFGRWGINYIYGTWCVLTGLSELSWHPAGQAVKKALVWLKQIQNDDGGFGESPEGYPKKTYVRWKESVPSQTAWALMALVAGGEAKSAEARRAAEFLIKRMENGGLWSEEAYTGTGFPGHFYIRYHGYRHFFPLLALGRYNKSIGV